MAEKKLQLEIQADASGVQAGVTTAKKSIHSLGEAAQQAGEKAAKMGDGAQQSAQKVDASTKNMIASIQRMIAATVAGGRANAEYVETLANLRGNVNNEALQPWIEQLRKVTEEKKAAALAALQASGKFNQFGKSAKEVELALRGVPAQLTDIFVSLQGGQAPLTVLLQQGGQLRDMFGGIAPAAQALGAALKSLINPYTVTAAVTAGLVAAFEAGTRESAAYARALIFSGNAAGATAGQLQALAKSISQGIGTQGEAAEVLAKLASSGQVSQAVMGRVGEAIVRMSKFGGQAVDELVRQFEEIGREPTKAIEKLNEKYNFLTYSVYEQIKALEQQGRVAEAAALAQQTLADTTIERAKRAAENVGYLERAWSAVGNAIKFAWDRLKDFGREDTVQEEIETAKAAIKGLEDRIASGRGNATTRARLQAAKENLSLLQSEAREMQRAAALEAERAAQQKAAIEAEQVIARIRERSMSKHEQMNAELKKYREGLEAIRRVSPDSELLDPRRIAADEAAIREQFRPPPPKAYKDDAAEKMLQQLRESEAATRAQLEATVKLTGAQKQLAEFEQLIADLKEKRVLTADQKSLVAAQDAIRAQLQKNVAVEAELQLKEQRDKEELRRRQELEKLEERIAQLRESMGSANDERRAQNDLRIQSFGMGREAREKLESEFAIEREFRRYREQLDKATPKELLGSEKYKEAVGVIEQELQRAKQEHERYFSALEAAKRDSMVGAREAIADYLSDAQNAAKQTYEIFTKAFRGIEDALLEFVRTGKLSFSSLVDSILADMARMVIRKVITEPLGDWLGGILDGARADGGPVAAGKTYLVGERGPELFVPKSAGTIVPNHALSSGGVVVNQTVNVGQGVSRAEVFQAVTAANNALKADLLRSRSREGVFA